MMLRQRLAIAAATELSSEPIFGGLRGRGDSEAERDGDG
jgi:hypothetical protein